MLAAVSAPRIRRDCDDMEEGPTAASSSSSRVLLDMGRDDGDCMLSISVLSIDRVSGCPRQRLPKCAMRSQGRF